MLCFLLVFPKISFGNITDASQINVAAEEEEANEDELSAISFENMVNVGFDEVPDAVHKRVYENIISKDSDVEISYAKIKDGKHKGKIIVSVSKKDANGKRQHQESFLATADGGMKVIKEDAKIAQIKKLTPGTYHSAVKLTAHVKAIEQSHSTKGSSYGGIRERYNAELVQLAQQIEAIGLENITEAQAREFYQKRRELGEMLKGESGLLARWFVIYPRNLVKYGDKLGPTYDSFAKKGMTPAQIAVKAVTSGGGDLGLESNADNPVIKHLKTQLEALKLVDKKYDTATMSKALVPATNSKPRAREIQTNDSINRGPTLPGGFEVSKGQIKKDGGVLSKAPKNPIIAGHTTRSDALINQRNKIAKNQLGKYRARVWSDKKNEIQDSDVG